MRTSLGEARLKSGETLHVSCVLGPEPSEEQRIAPFLGHKGEPWLWHIENALQKPLDDVETRFYIGEIEGEIVGNICTFENRGIGIFGHVFTRPEHRQKGIASAIMGLQMADFRERGGKALTLGTGYNSPAYHIYARHGFESVVPESGNMRCPANPETFERFFDPSSVSARAATWGDWPHLNLLFMRPGEPLLRNLAYRCFGLSNVEGLYIRLQRDREEGRLHGAWVMENKQKVPVGFATIAAASQWPGSIWQLDLCFHPAYEGEAPSLLHAIDWPKGKVQVYTERHSKPLFGALMNWGFRNEGHLARQLRVDGQERDITLWAKDHSAE